MTKTKKLLLVLIAVVCLFGYKYNSDFSQSNNMNNINKNPYTEV